MEKKKMIENIKNSFNYYKTDLLTFRVMTRSDIFPLFDATKNPEFNKNLAWSAPEDENEMIIQGEKLLREAMMNNLAPICVCEKDTGTWVGIVKFSPSLDGLEIGLWIHHKYWNTTIALKTGFAVVEVIYQTTKVEKIYCRIQKDNRLMKKILNFSQFNFLENGELNHDNGSVFNYSRYVLEKSNFKNIQPVTNY